MISESAVKNLRRGDVVTHIDSGKEFVVIENSSFGVTAICSARVSSGLEWVHSSTSSLVVEPPLPSLTQMIACLEGHGWTFHKKIGDGLRAVAPDSTRYDSITEAYRNRHRHTTKTKSESIGPFGMVIELQRRGWAFCQDLGGEDFWISPDGSPYKDLRHAYLSRGAHPTIPSPER